MQAHRKVNRFWTGVGSIVLGLVLAFVTFISIIGPVIGLVLVGFGILTLMWPETSEETPSEEVTTTIPQSPKPR